MSCCICHQIVSNFRLLYRAYYVLAVLGILKGNVGARDGEVMRALSPHQCGPGSNPGVDAICGLSLLLVSPWLGFSLDRFPSRYSGFPLSSKTNISKFQFDQESGRRRTTLWMCYLQIIIIIIFVVIIIIIIIFIIFIFIYIYIFIVMLGSIGILAFLGFIRMYTTISHPLDRSFFRIWKEAFETH